MADKEQEVRPLAFPSPAVAPIPTDQESISHWRTSQYLGKRRCIIWCCGCCGATVVVLGVIILILAFTIFKVKDPVLTMNNIYIDSVGGDFGTFNHPVSVNGTLTADISIKNPNVASFTFDNSTTEFYYQDQTVGVAYAPDGKVSAHRTLRMNVTVDVLADRLGQTNVTGGIVSGTVLNITSYTDISGRVNVLGIYKRDIEVMLNCSMTLDLTILAQEVKNKVCQANVR